MKANMLRPVLAASVLAATPAFAVLDNYWALDQSSGTNVPNSVAGGTNGTLFNGATWTTDPTRGQVLTFDGVDGYANLGSIPVLGVATNYTWSFWENSAQGSTDNVIFGNRYSPTTGVDFSPREFIKFTTKQFEWHHDNFGENIDYADIAAGAWTYNAVVKSGASLVYFRNGAYGGRRTITGGMLNSQPLYLGGDQFNENWQGSIDDVATWSNTLPVSSIALIASGKLKPNNAPLAAAPLTTVFTDNFSSGLGAWTSTNRGLEANAPAGYNLPSTAGGTLTLGGTTNSQYWYGNSIESNTRFDSTKESLITVDRLSLAGAGSAWRSSLWILGDDGHYFHFSENTGETGWSFNARDDGGVGTNNPTGGGAEMVDANFLEGGGAHQMGIRIVPTGDPGDIFAYAYLDGEIYGSQFFSNFPSTYSVVLTGQARAAGDSVSAQFDNVTVQQVPEPASAVLLLGGAAVIGLRRRR